MRTKNSWGDAVQWFSIGNRVYVWCSPLPRVGDLMKSAMTSGRVGVFVFTKIEPQRDPADMFFGSVEPIGYDE